MNKKNTEPEAIVVAVFLLTLCISSARHMRHPKPDIIENVSTSEMHEVEYEIEYVIEVYDGEHVNEMATEDEGEDGAEKEVQTENDLSEPQMGNTTINIRYPHLNAWEYPDPAVIDKINGMIEQEIKDHCDIELCAYEISYEIKCESEDIFSVLFEEMYSAWGAAHPNSIAWGLTFDMNTGDLLRAEDVIDLSWLQHKIEQKEYEQVRGIGMQYYEETARVENWYEEMYEGHSMDYYDEEHYHDYYLTDDKIGIIFGVSHAVGDYIFIEIEK